MLNEDYQRNSPETVLYKHVRPKKNNNNIKGIPPNSTLNKAAAHSFDEVLNGLDDTCKFKLQKC